MKFQKLVFGGIGAAVLGAAGWEIYHLGVERGLERATDASMSKLGASAQGTTQASAQNGAEGENATRRHMKLGLKAGDIDPANGRKILYYHDPMVPAVKFDKPGKSPFMDMMLIPVYAGASSGANDTETISVSPRMEQSIGLRTTEVREGIVSPQVSAEGVIAYNERHQVVIQARATGYVERLYVRAGFDRVRDGQTLVDLYVPDWVAAQEEFLALRRMRGPNISPLLDAARERMRQVGMTEEQIRLVESTNKAHPAITLRAPLDGVVVELAAREGMTVTAGATLFRINGLSTVWADAEVPESQVALLRPGTEVQTQTPAVPGTVFDGHVQAILPDVNPATRTIKVRTELVNRGRHLTPGMFVDMRFTGLHTQKSLVVPSDAVIRTGTRDLVMLAGKDGTFRPVEVKTGLESGGQTEIKYGLQAGQRVVISAQFLLDSEASLRGLETRLGETQSASAPPAPATGAPRHQGEARVEAIGRDAVTLSHDPIPSMHWGAMTMDFKLPPQGLPSGIGVGARVAFEFFIGPDGLPQLTRITPAASLQPAQAGAATPGGANSPGTRR